MTNRTGFVWLHLNLSHVATEKWLREHLQYCRSSFMKRCTSSRSTRIEHADQHLIAIINDVVHDFSYEASDISTLWVCASEKLIVTVRRTFLKSVDRLRQAVNQGAQLQSTQNYSATCCTIRPMC
jgi:zinc transporter